MKSDEEKLKELFEIKEKPTFKHTVKKAKAASIVRNVIISLMIFVIAAFVILILNATTLNKMGQIKDMKLRAFSNIAMPNAYVGGIKFDDRLMVGQIEYNKYRFLGQKPIIDGEYKEVYTYVPLINGDYGDNSEYICSLTSESTREEQEKRKYNKNGKAVMKFYHPDIQYEKYINDLSSLNDISKDKLMEMSLSFDKAYSIEEVKAMLPKEITLNWYWVDTFTKSEISKINEDRKDTTNKYNFNNGLFDEYDVYGIKGLDRNGTVINEPESKFIDTIMYARYNKDYPGIYKSLFSNLSNEKGYINNKDLKIIGVVVSGDCEKLKELKGKNYIKGATLGAVADRY